MTSSAILPVLIVGAGPAGMTAALDLAHYGIPSLLLDEDHKLSEGSRAIAFHQSALSVWEKLGAAQPLLDRGIAWSVRHTYRGGNMLYSQDFGKPPQGYLPRYINIPQFDLEQTLLNRIETNPLIDLRWDHKLVGFSQDAGSVTLTIQTPYGNLEVTGQYVLACDGARSTMRKLLHLDFPGQTFNDYFLIADIKAALNFPQEPRFFFDHPTNPGLTILIHPQPEGIWRIDWQLGAHANPADETAPEKMAVRIRALIGSTPYQIVWSSTYRFHQRLLENFIHGRVFFAGDAAHLVAPFGARGLNSAIQDVENLVWKLAYVLKGFASPQLLDTYQAERWAAQRENQRVTINTMRFMAPDTLWLKFRRNLILWLSGFYQPARKWVDSGKMSLPFIYTDTPLLTPDYPAETWPEAPALGAKPPDLPLAVTRAGRSQAAFLRHLFGSGFVALYFAENASAANEFLATLAESPLQFPLEFYPVTSAQVPGQDGMLDTAGILQKTLAAPLASLYLFRPDGHIAMRRQRGEPLDIFNYFEKLKKLSI